MRSTVIAVAIRLAISASLAVSGVIHAYLYVNGYRDIPTIGPAFLGQAIVFCVLAAADPRRRTGLAAVGRGCGFPSRALVAFALSRTVGLFGFAERGWNPSPQAAVSVIAEVLTVVFVAASVLSSRTKAPPRCLADDTRRDRGDGVGRRHDIVRLARRRPSVHRVAGVAHPVFACRSCQLTDPGGRRVDVVGTGGRRGVLAGAVVLAALDSGSAYGVLTAAALAGLAWAVGALPETASGAGLHLTVGRPCQFSRQIGAGRLFPALPRHRRAVQRGCRQ